jgi:O-antigen/teichoic acid export membrane protein
MRISKGFLKTSAIYTLAGMLPMASAFLLLPFYVNPEYLSAADYGALSIYLAFALLIQILTTYSFDTSLYVHYHEFKSDSKKLAAFISSAFVLMLMIGGGVALILLFAGDIAFAQFMDDKTISFFPFGILAAMSGIFQALFKVHSNLLQSREKPMTFFWSNLVSFLLIAGFTIVGLELYPHTLIGPVGGRTLALLISALWALSRIFYEFGFHFDFPLLRTSFQFNLYAFIYQLQQWVVNYLDKFIMLFYVLLSDVGIYDFSLKCLIIIELLLNGLYNAFFPKVISKVMETGNRETTQEVNRYYHGFTSVIMLLVCGSILIIPPLIQLFIVRTDYGQAILYLPAIAAVYLFRAMRFYFALPYTTMKYTKPLPIVYTGVVFTKIVLMVLLLERFEIYGVIVATTASAAVDVLLLWLMMKNRFHYRFNAFKMVIAPVLMWTMIIAGEFLVPNNYMHLAHACYLAFCLMLLWWVYRKEIKLIDPWKIIR